MRSKSYGQVSDIKLHSDICAFIAWASDHLLVSSGHYEEIPLHHLFTSDVSKFGQYCQIVVRMNILQSDSLQLVVTYWFIVSGPSPTWGVHEFWSVVTSVSKGNFMKKKKIPSASFQRFQ